MRLGKIGNTEFKISPSYLFLVVLIMGSYIRSFDSLLSASIQGLTVLGIITFILICHEMGHIKAAEKTGMARESELTLWALGGVAHIPGLKTATPRQELLTALAGPAVNLAFAIISVPIMWALGMSTQDLFIIYDPSRPYLYFFMTYFLLLNILTGVFNMIPSFPMDGGRVLRSALAMKMPQLRATTIASFIAWVIGGMMIVGGLWLHMVMMPLIGAFVILGSWAELRNERTKATAKDLGFEVTEDDRLL